MKTLPPSLASARTLLVLGLFFAVWFTASSCSKETLLPDARRAVLPSGDTIALECDDDDTDIPLFSLPPAIVTAIETEFPGWDIEEAELCDGGMGLMLYFIELENGGSDDDDRYVLYTEDGTRLEVFGDDDDDDDWDDDYEYEYDDDEEYFISASGDSILVDCDDDLPLSALPTAVTDAVAALYPDYSIEAAESCDATGLTLFLLELENEADDEIEVGFDADGNVYTYVDED